MALGSCSELEIHMEIAETLGFISEQQTKRVVDQIQIESKMITSLIKRINVYEQPKPFTNNILATSN